MTNPLLLRRAQQLVSDSSVPPHLIGFTFLTEAIIMKSTSYSIKLSDIYKTTALNHNSTPRAVTRDIKYAISQANGISDYLSVRAQDVFNGRVIAELALKLKILSHDTELQ